MKLFLFFNYFFTIYTDIIPHIIHYAWFSENPKTDFVKNCISSWKKYSPGWLIVQWTIETIIPFENDFIKEAYENKKYAFVADYLRVFALYNYGGIYLDSDVELTDSLIPFLNHSFFISQTRDKWKHVAPDCYGAAKGNPILKEMLEFYRSHHFIKNDGSFDETWVGIRFSQIIEKLYNIKLYYKIKKPIPLPNNGSIYPTFYFEQKINGKINYANHFCTGSWAGKKYDEGKYLANCYLDCRNNQNKSNIKRICHNFLNFYLIFCLFILLLIFDILLKCYSYNKYKYLFKS